MKIKLKTPIELNGVKVDQITLREPTVGDQITARRLANGDDAQFELNMFASLVSCAPEDLHALSLSDYKVMQKHYFRLVNGDEGAESAA